MKKKSQLILTIFAFSFTLVQAQDPFKMYLEKDLTWKASILKTYIKAYAGVDVNQTMLEEGGTWEILSELKEFPSTETADIDSAMNAAENGKKVFFFIENAVFGNLTSETTFSGSWQRKFPMCDGFYLWKQKSFQNEGLNYHAGTKEKNHPVKFLIMN
jgi:hypothetical protein